MKNQNILEVLAQINSFIRSQNPQRKADEGPHVNDGIIAAVMLTELMNLGMAVMAAGDTVIRAGFLYLLILQPAEFQTLLFLAGLEETAAAAATVVVGLVGMHLNKIFLTYNRFGDKPQIFRNGISITFAHDLARVLNRKLDPQIFVPVGIYFQFSFPDPFGIIFIYVLNLKLMLNVEFFQSGPD